MIGKMKHLAKAAVGGDEEAMGLLILVAPEGAMKGREPKEYATEIAESEDDEPTDPKVGRVAEILKGYIDDESKCMEAAQSIAALED